METQCKLCPAPLLCSLRDVGSKLKYPRGNPRLETNDQCSLRHFLRIVAPQYASRTQKTGIIEERSRQGSNHASVTRRVLGAASEAHQTSARPRLEDINGMVSSLPSIRAPCKAPVRLLIATSSTCRGRRIKCDEGKPTCGQCLKSDRDCQYGSASGLPESNGSPRREGAHSESPARSEDASAEGALVLDEPELSNPGLTDHTQRDFSLHLADNVPFGTETVSPGVTLGDDDGAVDQQQELAVSIEGGDLADQGSFVQDTAPDFLFPHSPLAPSQVSLLDISPFEWYDLLARDAINNIHRLDYLSHFNPSHTFNEATLSRRQSPAPESNEAEERRRRSSLDGYAKSRAGPCAGAAADHDATSRPWNTSHNIQLTTEQLIYLRYYVDVVGPILDLFDTLRHFTNVVPHLAMRNAGLLKSILAVAARHMSLGNESFNSSASPNIPTTSPHSADVTSGPTPEIPFASTTQKLEPRHFATQCYYETLQYLSQTLFYPVYADSQEILATAIMISTYEMFDTTESSGDWERHIRGSFWIQRSQNNNGESLDGLRRATWWAWLRQDIWAAFRAKRPTLTIFRPQKRLQDLEPDALATRVVFLAAKCVEFAAKGEEMGSSTQDIRQRIDCGNRLLQALQEWHDILPASYTPIETAEDGFCPTGTDASSSTGVTPQERHKPASQASAIFPPVWVHPPIHAGALQMYHFAKSIVLLGLPSTGGLNEFRKRRRELNEGLHTICGIARACQDGDAAMAFVNVQALFAGKLNSSVSSHCRVISMPDYRCQWDNG